MKIPAKRVYDIIRELIGEKAVEMVKALKKKDNISEFKLAEIIDLEINVTRNILYKLYDLNLVSFTRKKDQKKGWYIHYWTFNNAQVKFLIMKFLRNKIDRLQDRLDREQSSQYYICENKCIRFNFEKSVDFEFKCPECGELLNMQDNAKEIVEVTKQIKELKKDLKEFEK